MVWRVFVWQILHEKFIKKLFLTKVAKVSSNLIFIAGLLEVLDRDTKIRSWLASTVFEKNLTKKWWSRKKTKTFRKYLKNFRKKSEKFQKLPRVFRTTSWHQCPSGACRDSANSSNLKLTLIFGTAPTFQKCQFSPFYTQN